MPPGSPLITLAIVAIGFGVFIRIAKRRQSFRVEEFFVGGRNIGSPLFTHTTWGSSFAFGNSIFYGAWLGYSQGLSGLWLQALWALGMTGYACLLPRLIDYTQHHTLHGFLGSLYGKASRITASLVSVVGLLVLIGFEISFASQYLSQALGVGRLEWLLVIAFAIFIATFCSIGGFKANVHTDRYTNILAVTSLVTLLILMVIEYHELIAPGFTSSSLWASATNFSGMTWPFWFGLGCFSLFNFVDMSNWQNVSANSFETTNGEISTKRRRDMQWAMISAALRFLVAPVLTGTLLGYILKLIGQGTDVQTHFMIALVTAVTSHLGWVGVLLLGLVTFVFLASSLSGTDSWLLASTQTLSWDLIDYRRFENAQFRASNLPDELHEEITRRARITLLIVGICGAVGIYFVSKWWNDVFQLQFVIFGGGLSMLPALIYGIFHGMRKVSRTLSAFAFASIAGGYLCAIGIFVYSIVFNTPDATSPLPLVSMGVSLVIFAVGLLVNWFVNRFWCRDEA